MLITNLLTFYSNTENSTNDDSHNNYKYEGRKYTS